jgi:hypothetical protein
MQALRTLIQLSPAPPMTLGNNVVGIGGLHSHAKR